MKKLQVQSATTNQISNFGTLPTNKEQITGQQRNVSYEIVDTIYIKGRKKIDQYNKLIPIQVKIDANKLVLNLACNKKLKYCFMVNSLLFSFIVTNDPDVIFIVCNKLSNTKKAVINAKLHKTFGRIGITQIKIRIYLTKNKSG